MKPVVPLFLVLGLGSLPLALSAQQGTSSRPAPARTQAQSQAPASSTSGSTVPADVNGFKTIIAPPAELKPVKVAIYDGTGSSTAGVGQVEAAVMAIPGSQVTRIPPPQMGKVDLKAFDVVVFCGGSARSQATAIGEDGLNNVREFVRGGGGYVGICAGAYLSCSGFSWSLGIMNAKTVSSKWRRGSGILEEQVTAEGEKLLGKVPEVFKIRYNNGPVIQPDDAAGIAPYVPVALFRTELAENGSPAGVMVNSPAQALGTFGGGRVFISSPHPENTPGLEHLIPRAILWAADRAPSDKTTGSSTSTTTVP